MTATEIIEDVRSRAREPVEAQLEQPVRDLVLVSEELDREAVVADAIADTDEGRFVVGDGGFASVKAMLLKMK